MHSAEALESRSATRAGVWRGAVRVAALAVLLGACAAPEPGDDWPPGALLVGRSEAIAHLLAQLQQLAGTPLAREAERFAAALPGCPEIGAQVPEAEPAALVAALRCLEPDDALAKLRTAAGSPDLLFALPLDEGARLRGSARVRDGDVALEFRWPDSEAEGPLALLLPGDEAAGPEILSTHGRLLHLRVRPHGGLDVAALVPAGSQADRLFHLKSELFASAVLDGTWEAAVYLPESGGAMPHVALALGFRVRSAAVAAAERFVADLRASWPVRRSDLTTEAGSGACLLDLNVLPELAPCYIATDHALVVSWNEASLRAALDSGGREPRPVSAPARLDVDLALVQRADELLAQTLPPDERPRAAEWPWRHIRVRGEREGEDLRFYVLLERAAS